MSKLEMKKYPMGLTIKQLKDLIADWPEKDCCGEDTEVWVESGDGLSSPVFCVVPLNLRDGKADILFEYGSRGT